MNISPQVKNHSEGLKVNRKVNHLIPPYKQTTPQEQQRFEKSRQLPIVPMSSEAALILQPTPEQLLHDQQGKTPNQLIKSKPTPKKQTRTKPTPNKSTQHKSDIQRQKEEMMKWLNSVEIR